MTFCFTLWFAPSGVASEQRGGIFVLANIKDYLGKITRNRQNEYNLRRTESYV